MDIDIEQQVTSKKKKRLVFSVLITVLIIAAVIFLLRTGFSASIAPSGFSTAIVEMGTIENTLNASGEVVPEFEEIISSPIVASIKNVIKNAGSSVNAGESILALDKSATANELEKQKFQLESKKNNIRKLKLELEKSFYDIKSNKIGRASCRER